MIVEDAATREFCGALVRAAGWIPRAFASADEFLAHERVVAPGCLIVEATLPAGGGLELQQRAAAEFAETPIIFVAGVSDAPTIVKAMKAGAVEFLTAPICANAMLSAIDQALDRSRAALVHATEMRALRRRYQTLSPREREVMALVTRGLLNKQAAFRLGVCEITVKAHRGRVMRKMGAASFAELVAMATRLGLAREPQFSNAAPGHFARCA